MVSESARAPGRLWPVGLLLVLPLIGLAVLIARPELDLHWEHHPAHFWLVLGAAAVNVVLAYVTNIAAGRYHDAWQRAQLTLACVTRKAGDAERLLDEAERWLSGQVFELARAQRELVRLEDGWPA